MQHVFCHLTYFCPELEALMVGEAAEPEATRVARGYARVAAWDEGAVICYKRWPA